MALDKCRKRATICTLFALFRNTRPLGTSANWFPRRGVFYLRRRAREIGTLASISPSRGSKKVNLFEKFTIYVQDQKVRRHRTRRSPYHLSRSRLGRHHLRPASADTGVIGPAPSYSDADRSGDN